MTSETAHFLVEFSPLTNLSITSAESISPQGVDIWLLDLAAIEPEDTEKFLNILSKEELTRAQQFKKNQHYFIATRALLRKALSRYTRINPEHLLFSRALQGKPFLVNSPLPLYFNLSHSRGLAVLAVSSLGDLGVDIESIRQRDYLKIVERFFHADEHKQLLDCDEAKREQLFYSIWTLKEAFFKATGTGISAGLDKVRFHLHDNIIAAQFSEDLPAAKIEWQFYQKAVTATAVAAFAINSDHSVTPHWFDGNHLLSDG